MSLALRYAAMSHVGLLRSGNEDSLYAGPRLLAVADGMGGHAAGEVASAVAIAAVARLDEAAHDGDLLTALRGAAAGANDALRDMVSGDPALEGMGTTLTTLLFTGEELGLLHIGDSRAYLLRDGRLSQITHDDTLVQTLVDEGRITAEEASSHPQRNMILRALDGRRDVDFDVSVRDARVGDRYLLCSDGLTGVVGPEALRQALATPDPQQAVERLVDLALRGGGPDNITVVVADVVEGSAVGTALVGGAAADAQAVPVRTAGPTSDGTGPRRRRSRRVALLALLVLGALGLGAGSTWAWVRSQWYVGSDGDRVSVFRGVSGRVAGLDLSTVAERTDLRTQALSELDRQGVRRGIPASGPQDARRIVDRLVEHAVAVSAPVTPSPSPEPTAPPSAAVPSVPAPAPAGSVTPTPVAAG